MWGWQTSISLPIVLLLISIIAVTTIEASRPSYDNCKSEKLRELVLQTVGMYPHQYSYQAKYMKRQAEERFGNWWSAVIVSERGGYGMSAVYDQHHNTSFVYIYNSASTVNRCEMQLFDTFYWLGRTC